MNEHFEDGILTKIRIRVKKPSPLPTTASSKHLVDGFGNVGVSQNLTDSLFVYTCPFPLLSP